MATAMAQTKPDDPPQPPLSDDRGQPQPLLSKHYFPAEIIARIIQSFSFVDIDVIFLWTKLRHTSRSWKYEVERYFAFQYLPRLSVWIGTRSFIYPSESDKLRHGHKYECDSGCSSATRTINDARFNFLGISEDGLQVILGPENNKSDHPGSDLGTALERFQSLTIEEMLHRPCHVVRLHDLINDIYLPDCEFSSEDSSLRFNWRKFLSILLAEEGCFRYACQDLLNDSDFIWAMKGFQSAQRTIEEWEKPPIPEYPSHAPYYPADDNEYEYHELVSDWEWETKSIEDSKRELAVAVAIAEQAKKVERRRRIGRLHRTLLGKGLLLDRNFRHNESRALQRIDDFRQLNHEKKP